MILNVYFLYNNKAMLLKTVSRQKYDIVVAMVTCGCYGNHIKDRNEVRAPYEEELF